MRVFVVHGVTESGDEWSLVFDKKPTTDRILLEIDHNDWLRYEYEAECIQGWEIVEEEVLDGS